MTDHTPPILTMDGVSVTHPGATSSGRRAPSPLLSNISLDIHPGALIALIGPNGAGKSTLLKTAAGILTPQNGRVHLMQHVMDKLSAVDRARHVAYLPQTRPLAWPIAVRDVVALGRFAYGATPNQLAPDDLSAVDQAMADCGVTALADRRADTLSGGEAARMHVARALAANASLLLADEPVANLDPEHQFTVMALLRDHARRQSGAASVVVLHDLSLAAQFSDRIVWLKDGQVCADGPPAQTLTRDRIKDHFGVDAEIHGGAVTLAPPIPPSTRPAQ